jgi:vacuolar iron transporter family protein
VRPSPRRALLDRLLGGAGHKLAPDHHAGSHLHRDMRGGGLRAAIFGVSDGLVSNVSLVLGTAGAHPGTPFIRLAGIAGLLGGSFSMAAGEYISMRAQKEAFERELSIERRALAAAPEVERRELAEIYIQRGMTPELAEQAAVHMMANPELALATHAREELGIDPEGLGSPVQASAASLVTFGIGALVPLLPFLIGLGQGAATVLAVVLGALGALAVGALLSFVTERPLARSAARSLLMCAVAGGATFGIGALVGVTSS